MSSLKNRLVKLELSMITETEPLRIAHFIVDVDIEPSGYHCDGVEIIRWHDESEKSFKQRCYDAITWPDDSGLKIFEPI